MNFTQTDSEQICVYVRHINYPVLVTHDSSEAATLAEKISARAIEQKLDMVCVQLVGVFDRDVLPGCCGDWIFRLKDGTEARSPDLFWLIDSLAVGVVRAEAKALCREFRGKYPLDFKRVRHLVRMLTLSKWSFPFTRAMSDKLSDPWFNDYVDAVEWYVSKNTFTLKLTELGCAFVRDLCEQHTNPKRFMRLINPGC